MTNHDIAHRRLQSQLLAGSNVTDPAEIVRWMGAVQSQDYNGAAWALGLRAGVNNLAVEQAHTEGRIIRLHVLRPTWHFVAAEEAHWLLALTGPRVVAGLTSRYRELGLTDAIFTRSQEIFRSTLAGGRQLTRAEMGQALNQNGISTEVPQTLPHMLARAELDQVICSGAWRGKQATFALLDERVPAAGSFEREAALAELARRFFTSHGPAAIKDFTWWSGLTVSDARAGIDAARGGLVRETIANQEYWSAQPETIGKPSGDVLVHLLPNYDEYVVAYTDRSAIFDPAYSSRLHMRGGVLNNVVLMNGMVSGSWRRELKKTSVKMVVEPIWSFSEAEQEGVYLAARRYADFITLSLELEILPPGPG